MHLQQKHWAVPQLLDLPWKKLKMCHCLLPTSSAGSTSTRASSPWDESRAWAPRPPRPPSTTTRAWCACRSRGTSADLRKAGLLLLTRVPTPSALSLPRWCRWADRWRCPRRGALTFRGRRPSQSPRCPSKTRGLFLLRKQSTRAKSWTSKHPLSLRAHTNR